MKIIKKMSYSSAKYIQTGLLSMQSDDDKVVYDHVKRREYYYAFQAIYGETFKLLVILLSALLLGIGKETSILTFTFIVLRVNAGGFHMKTYNGCLIISLLLLLGGGALSKVLSLKVNMMYYYIFILFVFTFSIYNILKYAPVDNVNRPITDRDSRIEFRVRSIFVVIIWMVIVSSLNFGDLMYISVSSTAGMFLSSIMLNEKTIMTLNRMESMIVRKRK